jgi:drug/metabolite transporter (DMT)-like permease
VWQDLRPAWQSGQVRTGAPAGTIVVVRAKTGAALAVVYVVWGSTYVALRVGVRELPPLLLSGGRFLLAGLILYAWCRRRPGHRRPTAREWRSAAVLGLLMPAAGTGGATWAEQDLPAGTAALLLATIPVWVIVFTRVVDREPVRVATVAGLVLGLAGVAVLVDPGGSRTDLLSAAVALGGAVAWGAGTVWAGHAARPDQPLLGSAIELVCAGAMLILAGALGGELTRVPASALTGESALAFGYLVIFGSLLAYSSYEWLLAHAPARLVATYPFVNPVVAVLLGWWLLHEGVGVRTAVATAVIVPGVALIALTPARRGSERSGPAASGPERPPAPQPRPPSRRAGKTPAPGRGATKAAQLSRTDR